MTGEVGGKQLELFRKVVPKLGRVGVLHDPATAASAEQVKEVLPVAARALRLSIQTVGAYKASDDFDTVFSEMGKQRLDGLYVSLQARYECETETDCGL